MKKELKEKWLEALRSGKYPKTTGVLCKVDNNGNPVGYCCLGVLADIIDPGGWGDVGTISDNADPKPEVVRIMRYKGYSTMLDVTTQIETGLYAELKDDEDPIGDVRISGLLARVNDRVDTFDPVIELIEELVPVDEEGQTIV